MANTLHKVERLDKKKIIEKMFAGGSRSFSVFPLRVVYLPVEELAAKLGTINYELVCMVNKRVPRLYRFMGDAHLEVEILNDGFYGTL